MAVTARAAWHPALTRQLEELGRWMRDRFVVEPAPTDEVVPAERYLGVDFLRSAIDRAKFNQLTAIRGVSEADDVDLRIAVSRFTRQYASSVSAVALTALGCGVGLDLSAARCRMIVRSNVPFVVVVEIPEGEPLRCLERPTDWPVEGRTVATLAELRDHVWRALYGEHLAPLFDRAREVTRVSPNLMWSNAAEWVGNVSDAADEYLGAERARPFLADRRALLEREALPGLAGPNPLRGLLEWLPFAAPDFSNGVQTRHVCCVTYLLPDRLGRLCQNCPFLSVEDRAALIRERHGVPMGTAGGPAEQRAIAAGCRKLGLQAKPT